MAKRKTYWCEKLKKLGDVFMDKPMPVGISDFKKIIENNYYYVDKTLLIKKLLDSKSEILLLPRPRRFGKTIKVFKTLFEDLVLKTISYLDSSPAACFNMDR